MGSVHVMVINLLDVLLFGGS